MKKIISILANSKLRLSVAEMETSKTRCNCDFVITSLFFDEKHGYPVRAQGEVHTKLGRLITVIWNQYGECTFEGQRIKSFDLIKKSECEEVSIKMVDESLAIGLGVILFCIIFK